MDVNDITRERDEARANAARLREALESVTAAMWDRLYARGPLSTAYAQDIQRKVSDALAETPAESLKAIRAEARKPLIEKSKALADALEICHICEGTLDLSEQEPTHCENCSWDCDEHDEPRCVPLNLLVENLRREIEAGAAR